MRDPRTLPGPAWVDAAWVDAPVSPLWRRNLQALFEAGRLRETGRLCLLELEGDPSREWGDIAVDGGCSGLVVPWSALAMLSVHAHRLPLIVRLADPALLPEALELGAIAVAGIDPRVAARFSLPTLVESAAPLAALVEGPTDGPGLSIEVLRGESLPGPEAHGVRVLLDANLPDATRVSRLHAVQDALQS